MNLERKNQWQSELLDIVFEALAGSEEVRSFLVFKGARVLNARLGTGRQSLDLDSNMTAEFLRAAPSRDAQSRLLESTIRRAITRHFERQPAVRFELRSLSIQPQPPAPHPQGWDAMRVSVGVEDHRMRAVRGLPALRIDVAAAEEVSSAAVAPLRVGPYSVQAYTLERIAGEKLRAYLSSLPAYRAKTNSARRDVRVKDLYDLARIFQARGAGAADFWRAAGTEFTIACRSRGVDCHGIETFRQGWSNTQKIYAREPAYADRSFAVVEEVLAWIVGYLTGAGVVPFEFPIATIGVRDPSGPAPTP